MKAFVLRRNLCFLLCMTGLLLVVLPVSRGESQGQDPVSEIEQGRSVYEKHCATCHQNDGEGMPGGGPPLAGSSWVAGSEGRLVRITLNGLRGPIEVKGKVYDREMVGFREFLSDEEIASLLSYIRKRWGAPSPPVSPATVARIRAATRDRADYWSVEELLQVAP